MAKQDEPKKKASTKEIAVPTERNSFKNLILANPNYFGTFPQFPGKVVQALSQSTSFEELTCLGLQPGGLFQSGRLEAVLDIKQHSGYGTDGCGAGTTEFVRFFVQDTAGWHDLGVSSVQVYDLVGPLPLSYAVSVNFDQANLSCKIENILNVRAILSWNWEPTAGDPNFIPVWGNVINARVQVAPRFLLKVPVKDLIAQKALTIDPELLKEVDLEKPLPIAAAKPLSYGELKALYASAKVPAHRFGFKEASKLLNKSITRALGPIAVAPQTKPPGKAKTEGAEAKLATPASLLAGPELAGILTAIDQTQGNTTFEELTCAGYNPQTRTLEGVIQVKLSSGYSGNLCSPGSTEYVAFYAFIGGTWTALGIAQVQVHDLNAASPAHPVSYAVFRISNLTSMPCHDLSGVPLRAILSWETPPTGPNFSPVWGNILNTHVQPQIGITDAEQTRLMRIGRVTISNIDNLSGLAVVGTGDVGYVAGDCGGNDSPFGGEIIAEGDFIPKIDVFNHTTGAVLPGAKPIIYQAWVTPPVGPPFQLTNSFGIELFPPLSLFGVFMTQAVTPATAPVIGGVPGTQYYNYMESDLQAVNPRTLAVFEAGGLDEGNYTIEIRGFKFDGANYVAIPTQSKMIHVYNGYPHFELTALGTLVQEFRPEVSITLTTPAGDCGDVQVGDSIAGSYSVIDNFFSGVSIALVPITVGGIPQPENPVILSNANSGTSAVIYDGTNTGGTNGTFTLDTTGMTPCGYTILLQASDRALVSSSCTGHYNAMGVGFCLRAKLK